MDHSAATGYEAGAVERTTADRARVLLEINNAIVSHLDLVKVLRAISTCLRREIKHDLAGLALYNEELHELRLHALDFPADQQFMKQGQLIPLVGTPASLAFSTRKPVLRHRPDFEEFPSETMKAAYARGIKSGCAVPLICHDKIVGSMVVASLKESAFTEHDVELLTQIGDQAAIRSAQLSWRCSRSRSMVVHSGSRFVTPKSAASQWRPSSRYCLCLFSTPSSCSI